MLRKFSRSSLNQSSSESNTWFRTPKVIFFPLLLEWLKNILWTSTYMVSADSSQKQSISIQGIKDKYKLRDTISQWINSNGHGSTMIWVIITPQSSFITFCNLFCLYVLAFLYLFNGDFRNNCFMEALNKYCTAWNKATFNYPSLSFANGLNLKLLSPFHR